MSIGINENSKGSNTCRIYVKRKMMFQKKMSKYKFWLFYLVVFTLPMYTRVNNVLLALFIGIGLVEIFVERKKLDVRLFLFKSWPILGFFALSILASFREFDLQALKFLENHWSLLLVPVVMLNDNHGYFVRRRKAFLALLFGSTTTLLICNGYYIIEMLNEGQVITKWFNWRHFGHEFTMIADTHPTYLGLFVFTSILFLIQDNKFPRIPRAILIVFLLFGLLQLTSKMALLLFLLFLLYVGIYNIKKQRQRSVTSTIGLLICALIFLLYGGDFMKGRLFFVDAILDEKRIDRWEVSYEIFRENPVIGTGYSKIDEVRKEKYLKGDYSLAAENELNAHNQFLEYLSVAGALGGFVYAVALAFLFFLSIERKDHLFTFVFFAFILANVTESMMVRIKGIEYYAIFSSLFLCSGKDLKIIRKV